MNCIGGESKDPMSNLGGMFGKALIFTISVKLAEVVIEQGARGVMALWAWIAGDGTSDAKAKRNKKKGRSEVSAKEEAA